MSIVNRKWGLGIALTLTLAATAYLYASGHEEAAEIALTPKRHQLHRFESINVPQTAASNLLQSRFLQDSNRDIFLPKALHIADVPKTETVAPPPPTPIIVMPEPPPAPPSAPPIPFTYIGKYREDGELVVFLGYRGKNLIVKTGDIIQQTYKIEDIKPPLLTMTYLPMDIKQSIQIGEVQ